MVDWEASNGHPGCVLLNPTPMYTRCVHSGYYSVPGVGLRFCLVPSSRVLFVLASRCVAHVYVAEHAPVGGDVTGACWAGGLGSPLRSTWWFGVGVVVGVYPWPVGVRFGSVPRWMWRLRIVPLTPRLTPKRTLNPSQPRRATARRCRPTICFVNTFASNWGLYYIKPLVLGFARSLMSLSGGKECILDGFADHTFHAQLSLWQSMQRLKTWSTLALRLT